MRERYAWPALAGRVAALYEQVRTGAALAPYLIAPAPGTLQRPSPARRSDPRRLSPPLQMTQHQANGLYDPRYEHDACGVAFVARLHGPASHDVIQRGITANENLYHRGATGADPETGDGAGILLQMPDELYRGVMEPQLRRRPLRGRGVLPAPGPEAARRARGAARAHRRRRGPARRRVARGAVQLSAAGSVARACMPVMRQLFVAAADDAGADRDTFERRLYVIRRVAELPRPT